MPKKSKKPPADSLVPSHHFPAVRKAREALKSQALEILNEYRTAIKMAVASGKYDEALRAYQWLLDHVPNEKGERIFDSGSDKQQIQEGPKGPVIQIGISMPSTNPPLLESAVVDAKPVDD